MIREVLDWEPFTPLKEGLATTYEWIYAQMTRGRRGVG
jgi:hypothetical protein